MDFHRTCPRAAEVFLLAAEAVPTGRAGRRKTNAGDEAGRVEVALA